MAKGSKLGIVRGKVGTEVYYKVSGSGNKEKQGTRVYTAVVANPKTVAQAVQRLKFLPATAFYRAYKNEVLDHSFEGVPYGARSNAKFMKLALALPSGYPYVVKGSDGLFPGQYPLSRGSLVNLLDIQWDGPYGFIIPSLGDGWTGNTKGSVNAFILKENTWLKEGDQITFVTMLLTSNNTVIPVVDRMVLDPKDTTPLQGDYHMNFWYFSDDGTFNNDYNSTWKLLGLGVIISRPVLSKKSRQVQWLRSNSDMAVNFRNIPELHNLFKQEAYDNAINSYTGATPVVSSEWYLNQGRLDTIDIDYPVAPTPSTPAYLMTSRQIRDEESALYGKYIAGIHDPATNSDWYIGDDAADDAFYPYGWNADLTQANQSGTLYKKSAPAIEANDSCVAILDEQFDGRITAARALEIAQANGITLTIHS